VYLEIKNYGHETSKGKLIAGIVLTGGGSQLKHLRQLVEYITGMDARIGFPNEHLAGDSDEVLSSPAYATAVGLLMVGLDKSIKVEETKEVVPEIKIEPEPALETEPAPIVEKKLKPKKKSFFEKFTEGLKDFLDNAE
jgi:cell division protein FtsA